MNKPVQPNIPEWWPESPATRFLGRAGNSALDVVLRVVTELHRVCFIQWAPFDYDPKTNSPPEWAGQAATDDERFVRWCDDGLRAIRGLLPTITNPVQISWDVDASISLLRDEFDRAISSPTGDGKPKGRKQKADSGTRLKASARREIVQQWLLVHRNFDGTLEKMAIDISKEKGLDISRSTLSRILKLPEFRSLIGKPAAAARKRGRTGTEREAVSRESASADTPVLDAYTMPDDKDEDGTDQSIS